MYVALGIADPVAGPGNGDHSLWFQVGIFLRGEFFCSTTDILVPIVFPAVVQAALTVPNLPLPHCRQPYLKLLEDRINPAPLEGIDHQ